MKKILILGLLLICPQLAQAQTSRNPCYTTGALTTQGIPNCIGVGTTTPLPVTGPAGGITTNITSWANTVLGAPSNYGTSPGAVTVPGVNAFVTNVNPNGAAASAASSPVVIATDQSVIPVGGNVASGLTDVGNAVKIGGLVNTTQPTALITGQRIDQWFGNRGSAATFQTSQTGGAAVDVSLMNLDGVSSGLGGSFSRAANYYYNGATYDRGFSCPNTAVVNVTAGNTTQIVALSGATNIRVCSFAVSMSVAGTAAFVSGTGANCATGLASITGAIPLALGTPLAMALSGNSLFRAGASNALCVTAATGNVVGFVSYAQY